MANDLDRLLAQYGEPVRSWPGEEWADEEARANYAAANPVAPAKLRPDEAYRGAVLPFRETLDGRHEWAVPSLIQDVFDAAKTVRDTSGTSLGPMIRPSQYSPEEFEQILGHGMAGALTGVMGNIPRLLAKPPPGTTELGIFGGRSAKTADQAALAKAEGMASQGVPREKIWDETGWFQGADGQWRFEIDDSGAALGNRERGRLDSVVDHPELFEAYPAIGNARTKPLTGLPALMMGGGYKPASGIRKALGSSGDVLYSEAYEGSQRLSKLLHEGQHAVQQADGTAVGGSQMTAAEGLSAGQREALIQREEARLLAQAEKWNPAGFRDLTPAERMRYQSNYDKGRSEARARAEADINQLAYAALAGEVEARAVEKRIPLSPEQRQARPPWLDYDVPEGQQIVRRGSGEQHSVPPGIRAYHGSPHDFDKFDLSKIGTGEGAQAYGHGLYFAENEGVAQSYKQAGDTLRFKDGSTWDWRNPLHAAAQALADAKGNRQQAINDIRASTSWMTKSNPNKKTYDAAIAAIQNNQPLPEIANAGRMYEVNIKADPDQFLDWDKPIKDQSARAKAALRNVEGNSLAGPQWTERFLASDETFGDYFKGYEATNDPAIARKLKEGGAAGIRYFDGNSRGAGEGSRNYVVFDDKLLEIMKKYRLTPDAIDDILSRNNEAGFAPKPLPQRGFTDDYRGAVEGVDGSPLQTDIEGRPLGARFVAGRRTVGGDDAALTAPEISDIANAIGQVAWVPRSELPRRAVGSYLPTLNEIKIAADLPPDQAAIALSHELGHALADNARKPIDLDGSAVAGRKVYHDLRTGEAGTQMPGKFHSPELDGYSKKAVGDEIRAELLRAYMMDPNYVKTVAPKAAKAIRAAINADPWLSKIVQFNTLAGGLVMAPSVIDEILRLYDPEEADKD